MITRTLAGKVRGRKPRVLTTAKLRSYATDNRDLIHGIGHRPQKGLHNQASERRRSCNTASRQA
jgi:transposase-like protein